MRYQRLIITVIQFRHNLCRLYCTDHGSDTPAYSEIWRPIDDTGKYHGLIPLKKLEISYTTSSGPGGQNVNKCQTKAEVRFRVDECDWLPPSVHDRFFSLHKHRITKDGYFIIRSEKTRSQSFNLTDCLEKLRRTIRDCQNQLEAESAAQPSEEELEISKKRQEATERRRIQEKRRASEWKRQRRVDTFD